MRKLFLTVLLAAGFLLAGYAADISIDKAAESAGARAIVEEARKCTPEHPLFVLCGASLTNVAGAWLMDNTIEDKVVVVWIGGQEYEGIGSYPPPGYSKVEYNLNLSM